MKNLLFITTSSLAANPRLVKEFEALKNSFSCTVICFKHHDWSLELSEKIKTENKEVVFIEIDRRAQFLQTLIAKLKHKLAIILNPFFRKNIKICAYASNDKCPQILTYCNRKTEVRRIIAHNLGAFYPAVKESKRLGSELQLDIEDYYPGEALYYNQAYEAENRKRLMQYSFDHARAITYASEGIALHCQKVFTVSKNVKQKTIINAFKSIDFPRPTQYLNAPIKAVWFSQNIGPNRGLEQVFEAAKVYTNFEFHLIGNPNETYLASINPDSNVIFHDILPQWELHRLLSEMDIGLALESKDADFNRDICLTNKFLAYAQAGLYILATDTFGQRDFLESLDYNTGEIITDLSLTLQNLDNKELSLEHKVKRWQQSKTFGWEIEQLKLNDLLN